MIIIKSLVGLELSCVGYSKLLPGLGIGTAYFSPRGSFETFSPNDDPLFLNSPHCNNMPTATDTKMERL